MPTSDQGGDAQQEPTSCERCGTRIAPVQSIHTEQSCKTCGKTIYNDPIEQGLPVKAGQRVVIPTGAISLSLDRGRSSGRFTRVGAAWFASMLLFAGAPETPEGLDSLFERYYNEFLSVLQKSDALKDLDLDSEAGIQAAIERITTNDALRNSSEYWAVAVGGALAQTIDALEKDDALWAVWAMNRLTNAHAMLVFKTNLEEITWRGYLTDSLREVLQIWETNQHNADEEFWQQTFMAHPLILSQAFATPTVILKGKAYVGGKGIDDSQGKIADFLVANQLSENAALIEIKTPETPLLNKKRYREGVYAISPDLSGAIIQVATQRDALLKEYDSLQRNSTVRFSAFSPHGFVIVGHRRKELADTDRNRAFELFRQGLRDVQVVTFDELFSKIDNLLQSLSS